MTAPTVTRAACPDEQPHAGAEAYLHRFDLVSRAQHGPDFREGVLAAYRELGRLDLVAALVEDMEWLDQFDPGWPPALLWNVTYGTVRRAPDGTILDLTRPLIDREGAEWRWGGYTATGQPLVCLDPELGYFTPIGVVWDEVGPFTQPPAVVDPSAPCALCGTRSGTLPVKVRSGEQVSLCVWHPEAYNRRWEQSPATGSEAAAA